MGAVGGSAPAGLTLDGSPSPGQGADQELFGRSGRSARLRPFLPSLAVDWVTATPECRHRSFDASLAMVDVSGFTALTERLAARGKAGAEEVSDLVSGCFTELLAVAYGLGGQMLKWGGDAALLLFEEPGSAARASEASWRMCRLMERIGTLRTSAGPVELRVSIGVHRGVVDLYLVGRQHLELVVTGPAATAVARMESMAGPGEVVVSPETARDLAGAGVADDVSSEEGILLTGAPGIELTTLLPHADPDDDSGVEVARLLPPPTATHLLAGGEDCEHRPAAVAFIQFSGADEVISRDGADALIGSLERVVTAAQHAAEVHDVTFQATDISPDGGKIILLGGIPLVRGNDDERVLRAALDTVNTGGGELRLRAGVNTGRVFMHESGPSYRRIHSVAGDAVNLAARVMGRAESGQVLATAQLLEQTRSSFSTTALAPFLVKGKSQPVEAYVVSELQRSVESAAAPGAGPALLGRDEELALLVDAAERAASGRGKVVEVVAEAGMGKSTLVSAAMSGWSLRNYRLASEEYGKASPYLPFRWLLRAVLGLAEDADDEEAETCLRHVVAESAPELSPWLPLVGDVLGLSLAATPEVEQLDRRFVRGRLEQSVTRLLAALVTEPAAFVFEDTHEMDEASRGLLVPVCEEATKKPWLVVATRRPEGEPLPEDLVHQSLALQPLASDAALDLVGATGDSTDDTMVLDPATRAALVERAGGNPLFLRELALAARQAGSIEDLPDRLEPLLAAKVDRLDPGDRQVLRAAAVLGIRFDPHMVAQLSDEPPPDDIWARLAAYVTEDSGGHKRFSHALIRDAAYEGLSFRRRRDLHGRAADAISVRSRLPGDSADLLSLHSLHAERYDDAWRFSCLAGEKAKEVYANADAVALLGRALTAARHLRGLPAAQVSSVAEAMGDAAELTGRYDTARSAYARSRWQAAVDKARLLRKVGVLHERTGAYPQALRCFTRARRLVEGGGTLEAAQRADLAVGCAGIRFRQGRMQDCVGWAVEAAAEAELADHQSGVAHALFLADIARQICGEPWGDDLERSLSIYRDLGDLVGEGNVLNNQGLALAYEGRLPEALRAWEAARAVRLRSGDTTGAATQENNIAEIFSDQGHYQEAQALLQSARDTWRSARYPVGIAIATSNLGRLAVRQGRIDEGRKLLEEAASAMTTLGSSLLAMEADGRLVEAAVLEGDEDGADETVASASVFAARVAGHDAGTTLAPWARRVLATACLRAGDHDRAGAELDAAVALGESKELSYELAMALAARAVLAGTEGRADDARRDAERAVAIFGHLDVVDTPVTSPDDRWPTGAVARSLTDLG